ncbi:condensation domain-containing protein, partial [Chryseobacterium potabilaquae]|uniref:condensation domain-containing protein n=1 Tax=Chryseobacterium potabilaquae TaxID=2675057 RepID=UPI001E551DB1
FLGELSTIYKSLLVGESPVLPSMALQYRDFALWQRDYLSGDVLNTQLDYWKRELSGFESLNLPLDFKRPSVISYDGGNVSFIVPSSTSIGLRSLSKDLGVSLYSVMLSGYYVMLSAYSGQDDIVLGTPVANRHHVGLENMIGFFVNTLVLRMSIDFDMEIGEFIKGVSGSVSGAQIHQDLPFEKLVDELNIDQDSSRHPIFQVMFGLQSMDKESSQYYEHESFLQPFEGSLSYDVAKFDLTVMIDENGDTLSGTFNYAKSLFK